jgi:hypothetical protein
MRISDILNTMASWLESPENEAVLLAEYNDDCIKIVAESCIMAADCLRKAAEQVETIEPPTESNITPENIESLANLAEALDSTNDPELKKQASLIDELLLTIAADPSEVKQRKEYDDARVADLKRIYNKGKEKSDEWNKVESVAKEVSKTPMYQEVKIQTMPLKTRLCPDHQSQMFRIADDIFQCDLDGKQYNFREGFTLEDGRHFPGGGVDLQRELSTPYQSIFDSREGRLLSNKAE